MPDLPLSLLAFIAGILMFLAPCTLPIVPGYLAFIAGVPQGETGRNRRRIIKNAAAFVLGFSILFIVFGLFAVSIGQALGVWRLYLPQVAGGIITLFGLTLLGVHLPFLSSERHVRIPRMLTVGRVESSFLVGALFALGWSPCVGPILGTVLLLATGSDTAGNGALLLALFSAGLAVPFLLCALLIERAERFVARIAGAAKILELIGGVLLVAVGLLMLTNYMGVFITMAFKLLAPFGYTSLLNYL
jgi:cytochrome c-type biogenesis protein